MGKKTTWRKELEEVAISNGDKFEDLKIAINEGQLDRQFYNGFGGVEGAPFTAWSDNFVYFPVCYDGAEWVGFVPRNICDKKTRHIGGG